MSFMFCLHATQNRNYYDDLAQIANHEKKKIDTFENRTLDSMNIENFVEFKDHTHNNNNQSIER